MKTKTALFDVLPYDSPDFKQAWEDWILHRQFMKEPLGPMAVKRQLNFLKTLGEAKAIQSIDNSINHNWTGLFPPKETFEVKPYPIAVWDGKKYGQ